MDKDFSSGKFLEKKPDKFSEPSLYFNPAASGFLTVD